MQSEDEVVCSWELLLVLPFDEVLSSLWTKIITILPQSQKKIANDIFIVIAAVDYSISCTQYLILKFTSEGQSLVS